jgi:hypothetical protein
MAAEPVTEQVAEHIEEVAQVTRQINDQAVKYFFGGLGVGLAIGFFFGYRFNREKIRAEAFAQSAEEIDKMREIYEQRRATVVARQKPSIEEIVEEKGYRTEEESHRPLRPPVPTSPAKIETTKHTYRTELAEKDKMDDWSFPKELSQRTPNAPYIIHQDEFAQNESEFSQVSYVYYVDDDILVDEEESPIENRDEIIGSDTVLTRFGHGTDDYNILYVRNPVLELEMEINRVPSSYAEEVLGLDPNEPQNAEEE